MKTGIAIAIALLLAPSMACAQERNSLAMDLGTNPAATNAFHGNKVANGDATHKSAFGRVMDGMIASLKKHLGPAWRDTLVIVTSEFGRTVRANGSSGSDHGTANALFALGGALPRTGIIADWPGLATSSLHEGRDLRTTRPVEAVLAALAGAHFAVEPGDAARLLYPALPGLEPLALA